MSLAWAISEYLAKAKVRAIFATHFHELTALTEEFLGVKTIMSRSRSGITRSSSCIKSHPAEATTATEFMWPSWPGYPKKPWKRAEHILTRLELDSGLRDKILKPRIPAENQLTLFTQNDSLVLDEIKKRFPG